MAKKKKKSTKKKKKQEEDVQEKSHFFALAVAILLMVFALFLLLGGFGTGGNLPETMFNGVYWALGWGAYLAPAALLFFGIWKFTHEEKRIPRQKYYGTLALLAFMASWLHVAFVSRSLSGDFSGGHGGNVGSGIGSVTLSAFDKVPATILFFVLSLLMLFLVLDISPEILKKLVDRLKKNEASENELADAKQNAANFEIDEGVPVEHHGAKAKAKLSNFKDTAEKPTSSEDHAALTAASDPEWEFPSTDLLIKKQDKADAGDVEGNAQTIKQSLEHFNIDVEMEGANIGPRVTQYTLKPPAGTKLSKLTALDNNLALELAATSIRIEAPIPGKRAVGIEVPNVKSATVRINSMLNSEEWTKTKGPLGFVIGKDIAGKPIVGDLAKMPHMMIAGQTGSGKSVMINTFLTSLLYRNSPSDLKLVLVDPKQVELKPYDDIPHLLTPVITEPEKCISALKWTVAEMERRYKALSDERRRNIAEYNSHKQEEGMPYIVVVIDELADIMMMAARDVEALIVRIAQKARAVGIHLVLATQRPSVDVITGLIKANVPARIAFTTASQVDSRTIIDQIGAEKLLGQGDMLFLTAEMPKPKRVQGAFISDEETHKVTDFIRMQRPPQYDDEIVSQPVQLGGGKVISGDGPGGSNVDEDMYKKAVEAVVEGRKASTSLLQRRLRVGYGRAARLIETMEEQGIIGPADGNRPREVLVTSLSDVYGGGEASVDDEVLDENFAE